MPNTIRVNLSAVADACEQDPTPAAVWPRPGWYAFLYACDMKPLVRAGKEYGPFPIDHGYAEIRDVPPGKYVLFAIVNPFPVAVPIPGGEEIFQANFASHFAVVDICDCCDNVCVTLYNSGWHYCVQVIIYWFELLILQGRMEEATARSAIEALSAMRQRGPAALPGDAAAIRAIEGITNAFRDWHKEQPRK